MIKLLSTISAFTLIFMVSASAQEGLRRSDQRYMGEPQRRDLYQQQRRRDYLRAERPGDTTLGPQPWWRTENWCDDRGFLFLCR